MFLFSSQPSLTPGTSPHAKPLGNDEPSALKKVKRQLHLTTQKYYIWENKLRGREQKPVWSRYSDHAEEENLAKWEKSYSRTMQSEWNRYLHLDWYLIRCASGKTNKHSQGGVVWEDVCSALNHRSNHNPKRSNRVSGFRMDRIPNLQQTLQQINWLSTNNKSNSKRYNFGPLQERCSPHG
jgi:hypothetical protein